MKINGLKVVDATKPLPIKITDNDVENGNTKDPGGCAAALACMRKPTCTEARVHIGRTYLKEGGRWVRYKTPAALRSEIISFDRGADFQPDTYVLVPMSKSGRLGQYTHVSKNKKKNPLAKKRAKIHVVRGVRAHGANR